ASSPQGRLEATAHPGRGPRGRAPLVEARGHSDESGALGCVADGRGTAMSPRLSTAREIAEATGFKTGTILDWHEQGKLPPGSAYKFGPNGRLRFDLEKILAAFEAGQALEEEKCHQPFTAPGRRRIIAAVTNPIEGGRDAC